MVSTRSRATSNSTSSTDLPQKRPAGGDASPRPAKKTSTPNATDLAVGKSVTKNVTLVNQDEKDVVLADTFRDQGVIFFMYPRANTPGCTKQACGFRDNIQIIKDAGYTVYGLSGDSPKSLSNWKAKENLPFDLLSDPEHQLISYFGSSLPGNKVQRSHVVVLKGGVVGDISGKVSPALSISRAVEFVKAKGEVAEKVEDSAKEEEPAKEVEPMDTTEKLVEGSAVTLDAELQTHASTTVKVKDLFKTRGAIFFMYPKADTPGCTIQACGFNDNLEKISAAGFDVYGLGADSPAELLAWKEAQKYKYTFLSDSKHQLIGYFGSSLNDGTRVERSHVIVLPGGKVGQIEHNISPQDSVSKGLAFAQSHAIDAASKL